MRPSCAGSSGARQPCSPRSRGSSCCRLRDLRLAAWAVILAYLLVGCHWFQPWYATWLIALASLAPDRRVAGYTLVFSCFMLLHPILSQYFASRLALPPGAFHAIMAAGILLVPQALAVYMAFQRSNVRTLER